MIKDSATRSVLSKMLRAQRKKMGLTQVGVAKMMGISRRVYQRLESGASMELYDKAFEVLEMKVIVLPKDALR